MRSIPRANTPQQGSESKDPKSAHGKCSIEFLALKGLTRFMQKLPLALLSVCVTFLAWGLYGILLHEGQQLLGRSALRSFVGVGIAYFLVAVLVPAFLLSRQKEKGYWSFLAFSFRFLPERSVHWGLWGYCSP